LPRYALDLWAATVAETRELGEDTTLDLDLHGRICAITIEHASQRAGAPEPTYEQVGARA